MAPLYIVSTPIGNLSDITLRALDALRDADRVYAEDTRRTRILCHHHQVSTPLRSIHKHNEAARVDEILDALDQDLSIAVVSDAGTPLVSDPGAELVRRVIAAGHDVVPVPGASAVLVALVASGLPSERFVFLGFVPRKGAGRARTLARIAGSDETSVVFEAPGRLVRLLEDLAEACEEDRQIAVARELTKMHESVLRGTPREAWSYYEQNPPRGEVTVVVAPSPTGTDFGDIEDALALARDLLDQGYRPSQAAKEMVRRTGMQRNQAYRVIHSLTD